MVAGLAFLATAVATVFAQATAVRWSQTRKPHNGAWSFALALFALASAALALGTATGWDPNTFRVFFLLGAIVNVPWLALGTIYLLASERIARATRAVLMVFSGFAAGVMFTTPIHGTIDGTAIPVGKDHLDVLPRVLAGVGSGVGATVILAGAVWSAVRFARRRSDPISARLMYSNLLIALGVLVLSSGGLLQGIVGKDEAFALSLAIGICVIYAGFAVASSRASSVRDSSAAEASALRTTLPPKVRGTASTTTRRVGNL
jgi:hypothetical protein